jgi:site-specific DNA-methyltransferase (adenine-specific)
VDLKTDNLWLMQCDCLERMKEIESGSVDLTVTSPPYDNLRSYNGNNAQWGEHVWKAVIAGLYRVTKQGGVVVWVVGDATIKGSETGTSFKQALWAIECGFNLHDTMIYHKNALPKNHNRYEQDFEYMFVLSKGKPKSFNPIRVPTKYPEKETARQNSYFTVTDEKLRSARSGKKRKPVGTDKIDGNIWYITTGKGHSTLDADAFKHPAIFPEKLAERHIISWSNAGDVVFDPFMGSGTTGKMALLNDRKFIGIELDTTYFDIAKNRILNTNKP